MVDEATKRNVSQKFEAWARTLSEDEQGALAQWITNRSKDDVRGHTAAWWKQSNAWADAWWQTW